VEPNRTKVRGAQGYQVSCNSALSPYGVGTLWASYVCFWCTVCSVFGSKFITVQVSTILDNFVKKAQTQRIQRIGWVCFYVLLVLGISMHKVLAETDEESFYFSHIHQTLQSMGWNDVNVAHSVYLLLSIQTGLVICWSCHSSSG
jgi:hypothetical protein